MYQDPCSIYLPRLSLQTLVILHSKTPSCCKYLMWTASYGSLVKAPKNGCRLPHSRWGCTWTSGRHTLQVCKPSQQSVCIWLDGQQRCKGNLAAPPHPVSPIWLTLMELADVFYLSSYTGALVQQMDFSQGAPFMSLCRATSTHGYIVFENCNHATMVQVPDSVRKLSWMHPNEIEETG